jgi:RimJ/RimL family protein N-acetyltransferase|tara:strand:+ start:1247 stop:1807 length:561 start_codon:yes stop_codon:yes gene_type:complete
MPLSGKETLKVKITGNKVILREKRLSDAWNDYTWETNSDLAQLDAVHVLTIPFSRYLTDYSEELRAPFLNSHRFAIDTRDGKHIGNCSYYHISEIKSETELGIMIGDRNYWNKGYGEDTVTTMVDYIFRETKLKRIYLKTLESNNRAQKCFQKCGFVWYEKLLNDGFNFILMETSRKHWLTKQKPT